MMETKWGMFLGNCFGISYHINCQHLHPVCGFPCTRTSLNRETLVTPPHNTWREPHSFTYTSNEGHAAMKRSKSFLNLPKTTMSVSIGMQDEI